MHACPKCQGDRVINKGSATGKPKKHCTGQLLDWECGQRDKKTLKKMVDRVATWDVKMSYPDQ